MAVMGEHIFGAGRGTSNFIYITVSTGISAGLIFNSKLYEGGIGVAGEFGHITLEVNGPRCGCGNNGCLESLSSGTAIERFAAEALTQSKAEGLRDFVCSKGYLTEQNSQDFRVTARIVKEAALANEEFSYTLFKKAASYLGIGVASLVNLLNPEVIAIGGSVAKAGRLLFEPVYSEVEKRTLGPSRNSVRILPSELGDNIGLIGAAAYVLEQMAEV